MSVPISLGEAEKGFIADYDALKDSLPGAGLDWLTQRRDRAMQGFAVSGLPHRRVEAWKYSDLRAALSAPLPSAGAEASGDGADLLAADPFAAVDGWRLVFVNGVFRADLSDLADLPEGVDLLPVSDALDGDAAWLETLMGEPEQGAHHAVQQLNLALARDGVVLRVAEAVTLERAVRIVTLGTDEAADRAVHVRHAVLLGAGAKATILESHLGVPDTSRFTTVRTDTVLGEGADLTHLKIQADGRGVVHMASTGVTLGERARFQGFALTSGGRMTRNEVVTRFDGPHAYVHVAGASLLVDRQHCDNTMVIDHAVPDCESHELFKTVAADKARGVFQGKIIVRKDAQRTDGYQLSQALLLSPGAEADTKPELEIYADDVKCSHGATMGELDAESIFYLRSRGIEEGEAKALLVGAFVTEAIDVLPEGPARTCLAAHVEDWLIHNRGRVTAAAVGQHNGLETDNGA